jgi:hypothetical protein
MSDNQNATWWSPDGFDGRANPVAWDMAMTALNAAEQTKDYFRVLNEFGYEFVDQEADFEHSEFKLNVAINDGIEGARQRHAFVEVLSIDMTISRFFVDDRHLDAFFATKYLELRKDLGAIRASSAQCDMRRYFLAFIRYGHGKDTVDSEGCQTRDEWVLARELAEQRRRRKDAEKQAAATPPPH